MRTPSSPDANIGQERDSFTIVRENGDGPVTWWAREGMAREAVARNVLQNPVMVIPTLSLENLDPERPHIIMAERENEEDVRAHVAKSAPNPRLNIEVASPAKENQMLRGLIQSDAFWEKLQFKQVVLSAPGGEVSKATEGAHVCDAGNSAGQAQDTWEVEPGAPGSGTAGETVADLAPEPADPADPASHEPTVGTDIAATEPEPHPMGKQSNDNEVDAQRPHSTGKPPQELRAQEKDASGERVTRPEPEPHPARPDNAENADADIDAWIDATVKSQKSAADALTELRSASTRESASGSDTPSKEPESPSEPETDVGRIVVRPLETAKRDAEIAEMVDAAAKSGKPVADVVAEFRSARANGTDTVPDTPSEEYVAPTEPDADAGHLDRPDSQIGTPDADLCARIHHPEACRSEEQSDPACDAVESARAAERDRVEDDTGHVDTTRSVAERSEENGADTESAAINATSEGKGGPPHKVSSMAARVDGARPDDDAVLVGSDHTPDSPNWRDNRNHPSTQPLSHHWCADRFARQMGSKIRFTEPWGTWQEWVDDEGWQRDATSSVNHRCGDFLTGISIGADKREQTQVQSTGFTRDVVKRTGWRPEICVKDSELWDADLEVLGLPDGLVCDLKTSEVRPADPNEMITIRARCVPSETTDCPEFLAALDQWTMDDPAFVDHIQRTLGYGLTGLTIEERLIFIHGGGGNGKSVLAGIVRAAMGEYADVAPEGMFTAAKFRGHLALVASTQGKRLLLASETNSSDVWDAARVKLFTGGEPMKAHFMRRDPFTFTPKFMLMFLANNLPAFEDGVDDAIRRRFLIWPFRFKASPSNRDNKLKDRIIQNELPGVLRWLIEGCRLWMNDGGLKVPPIVEAETQEYLASQDLFSQFLEDECEIVQGEVAPSTPLYRQWVHYTKARGEEAGTQTAFGLKLKAAGFENFQGRVDGVKGRGWQGLRLARSTGSRGER